MTSDLGGTSWRTLYELQRPLAIDQRTREVKVTQPDAWNAGPSGDAPARIGDWSPDGRDYVTLFVAQRGSGQIHRVRQGLSDPGVARELEADMKARIERRSEVSVEQAIEEIVAAPVYAEFRYAEVRLAEHLFVPDDIGITAVVFPYEGGRIDEDALKLVQFIKPGSNAELEALAVYREPVMTEAERAAASGIGRLYRDGWCDTTGYVAATYAGAAAAAAWAAAFAGPTPGAFDVADLGDEVLNALDADPAVDDLVRLRLSVLDGGG